MTGDGATVGAMVTVIGANVGASVGTGVGAGVGKVGAGVGVVKREVVAIPINWMLISPAGALFCIQFKKYAT